MDLSKYNVRKHAELGATCDDFVDPAGKIIDGMSIKLLGTDSKVYREKHREFQRKRIQKMTRNKRGGVDLMPSDEDICELLAACTVEWSNIDGGDGEAIECTYENAYDIYMEHLWLREQVEAFIGDRENFFPSA